MNYTKRNSNNTSVALRRLAMLGKRALLIFGASAICAASGWATTYTVTNENDTGPGSLRQAIIDANAHANSPATTPDTISVDIPIGLQPWTIKPVTPLPQLTDAVRIINAHNENGRVELDGTAATQNGATPTIGFDFAAQNCTSAAPACELWGFAINRWGVAGVHVGPGANNTIITQNYIGTDATGLSLNCPDAAHPCGNLDKGIWVEGATNVRIGTNSATIDAGLGGHSNTIGGNFGPGIVVSKGTSAGVTYPGSAVIHNNYVGISNPNTGAGLDIGNGGDGILIAGTSGNVIGGSGANDTNYIGGNAYSGINLVTDVTPGADPASPIVNNASNNTIQGNYIGQTVGSNASRGNDGSGIVVRGANNTIGGTTAAERNYIVANAYAGISISGSTATGNVVQGNYIGVNAGDAAAGNQTAGIVVAQSAANNLIGGTGVTAGLCDGACNEIANNGTTFVQGAKAGIYIDATAGFANTIRENSLHDNGSGTGIGIDLGTAGKNANDAGDADSGANDLQNKPVLSTANTSKFIAGSLTSTPSTPFTIDFYLNSSTDLGNGAQARAWIGSTQVATSAAGTVNFNFTTTVTLPQGANVTATATQGSFASAPTAGVNGDTSELSDPVTVVTAPTAAGVTVAGRLVDASGTGLRNATVTMTDMNGKAYSVLTNAFGYFNFADIPSGESYIVAASRKGYRFDSFMLQITDSVDGLTITARP